MPHFLSIPLLSFKIVNKLSFAVNPYAVFICKKQKGNLFVFVIMLTLLIALIMCGFVLIEKDIGELVVSAVMLLTLKRIVN